MSEALRRNSIGHSRFNCILEFGQKRPFMALFFLTAAIGAGAGKAHFVRTADLGSLDYAAVCMNGRFGEAAPQQSQLGEWPDWAVPEDGPNC